MMRLCWKQALACLLLTTGTALSAQADEPTWRVIEKEDGVVVSVRDEPGRSIPRLRAQARIQGSILDVLAVVLDDERAHEWAAGSSKTSRLRSIDAQTDLVYTRSNQPWPVRDRDVIMKRTVDVVKPAEEFFLRMVCAPEKKARLRGVVRVEDCESTLVLRKVDATTTAIDYQVSLDPGGHIPRWLVEFASRELPFDTVTALEKQVKKTRGRYQTAVRYWSQAM